MGGICFTANIFTEPKLKSSLICAHNYTVDKNYLPFTARGEIISKSKHLNWTGMKITNLRKPQFPPILTVPKPQRTRHTILLEL